MSIEAALRDLEKLRQRGEVTAWVRIEPQPGSFVPIPRSISPGLRKALQRSGIQQLYSHQREAFQLGVQGHQLVVVTPTASGKSLCYNLPVLHQLLKDPKSRALYLFPTKALAQDQMFKLRALLDTMEAPLGVHTYDGDTPGDARRKIRRDARIVLSNPDMLHTSILPHHPKWVELFQNLRYIVVDELHTYRGIFGSHVANVFRRLKRIASFYDSRPQFLCASATIANPSQLAQRLLEEDIHLVESNGAPRSRKDLVFYNPPLVNPQLGLRASSISAARRIARSFLRNKVQTILFAPSRVTVEVLTRYLKDLSGRRPADQQKIRGYRGGYLPATRREIERQLQEGEIQAVVSTNALELGIDVGGLDACILVGYPGTVASTWQQAGRAGRRGERAAAVLVARNFPIDQFIISHPDYFLERSPENGLIHPDNLHILLNHIKCAAFELPFRQGETFGREDLEEILNFLAEKRVLHRAGEVWHWTDESYPAESIGLRNISEENFVVIDRGDQNRVIAEVDFESAPELIHEQAIYLCDARQYQVESLDYGGRKAYVREVTVDHYTEAITESTLRIVREDDRKRAGSSDVAHGEVHLVSQVPGFKKIQFYTGENLGYGKIELPTRDFHTSAYWFTLPESRFLTLGFSRDQMVTGLLGISYGLQHVATLVLMCDVRDLGRSVGDRSARWFARPGQKELGVYSPGDAGAADSPDEGFDPTVFLYEKCPGGVGFSEKLFGCHETLLRQTLDLIQACGCPTGCPSCVGPVEPALDPVKQLAQQLLSVLLPQPADAGRLAS